MQSYGEKKNYIHFNEWRNNSTSVTVISLSIFWRHITLKLCKRINSTQSLRIFIKISTWGNKPGVHGVSRSSLLQQVRKVVGAIDGNCKQGDIRCRKSDVRTSEGDNGGEIRRRVYNAHDAERSGSLSLCSRRIYSTPCRNPSLSSTRKEKKMAGRLDEKTASRTRRRNLGPDNQRNCCFVPNGNLDCAFVFRCFSTSFSGSSLLLFHRDAVSFPLYLSLSSLRPCGCVRRRLNTEAPTFSYRTLPYFSETFNLRVS